MYTSGTAKMFRYNVVQKSRKNTVQYTVFYTERARPHRRFPIKNYKIWTCTVSVLLIVKAHFIDIDNAINRYRFGRIKVIGCLHNYGFRWLPR